MNILDDVLTEETIDDGIDENEDNEMPTCVKVGLGLLCAGVVGIGICKLLSSDEKLEIDEDVTS